MFETYYNQDSQGLILESGGRSSCCRWKRADISTRHRRSTQSIRSMCCISSKTPPSRRVSSQGDTNNLTFGIGGKQDGVDGQIDGWGYYETIAGGAGAGPGWIGASGVHTHMTNTRITDGESNPQNPPLIP